MREPLTRIWIRPRDSFSVYKNNFRFGVLKEIQEGFSEEVGGQVRAFQEVDFVQQYRGVTRYFEWSSDSVELILERVVFRAVWMVLGDQYQAIDNEEMIRASVLGRRLNQ